MYYMHLFSIGIRMSAPTPENSKNIIFLHTCILKQSEVKILQDYYNTELQSKVLLNHVLLSTEDSRTDLDIQILLLKLKLQHIFMLIIFSHNRPTIVYNIFFFFFFFFF